MRLGKTALYLLSLLLVPTPVVSCLDAQDTTDLTGRMQQVVKQNALDNEGLTPWHMKLELQTFDPTGKSAEQGTVEVWWAAADRYRILWDTPSYKGSEIGNASGHFYTKTSAVKPVIMDELLDQELHPVDSAKEIDGSTPELRKQKFGKVELECVMLDRPVIKGMLVPPLGLFPTYCLDPGKLSLRIAYETGSIVFVRSRIGTFQGRNVGYDVDAESDGKLLGKSHLAQLTTFQPTDADFRPGDDMETAPGAPTKLSAALTAGKALSKTPPVYPQSAKQQHLSGIVILRGIIGRDGHIRNLQIISAPSTDLAISAVSAVRHWTYSPYLLKGLPIEVDTTITVNYDFAPA